MKVKFILTAYSASMFGDRASIHQRTIDFIEASTMVDANTQIVATRPSHENLAKNLFGDLPTTRFADLSEDCAAILIHYRGPPVVESGELTKDGSVTLYLLEREDYLDPED